MRLRLKALAARDAKTPAPADLAARPAVLAAVAQPAAARDVADLLVNFADAIVRALAAPGTPERAETLATFDTALQRLEADTTLSRADRMQALIARIDLVRIDLPEDAEAGAGAQGAGAAARPCARGGGPRRPRDHRRLRAPGGRSPPPPTCWSRPGSGPSPTPCSRPTSRKSHSPYYLMSGLASNAKRRGDKAEALHWYREAYEKSEGPATRLQWGASYLNALVDLVAGRRSGDRRHHPAALARGRGPARRLRAAQRPLAAARRQEAAGLEPGRRARRVDDAPARRARHALRLAGPQRRRPGGVQVAADAGGEGERLTALLVDRAPERALRRHAGGRRRVVRDRRWREIRARRRVRLGQVDHRALGPRPGRRRRDERGDPLRRPRPAAGRASPSCARCAAARSR